MRWTHWLLSLVTPVEDPCPGRKRLRACRPAKRFRPQLEVLEDRHLLSSFTVVLATDNGGPTGQKVSATSGDLRYCVEQADAVHTATTDSIGFSSKLTTTPHTITLNSANGPLVLSDSHPLTINGPTALTLNVSGGGQVEVFDITSGTVTIKNLAIIYGNAVNGGGIYNQGTLTLTNCFLDHDTASSVAGKGGGIFNAGTATLTKCTLYLDSAAGGAGGGIYNLNGTIMLSNCNVSNDAAALAGGGIYNNGGLVTLGKCTLSADRANGANGGGIWNGGNATLIACILNGDSAFGGGGFYNDFSGGALLISCTLSNNFAGGSAGGIYNGGIANLANCTLANNSAGAYGGGMFDSGSGTLTNCTLSNNSANYGGGIVINFSATLNLTNTIAAGNTATTSGPDIDNVGAVTADHDLIGDGTNSGIANGGGNIVGGNGNPVIDARLGPLQNNGGPTETMALLPDSPAIGIADNTKGPATDERGIIRIDEAGETTDIGAFEL